MNFYPFNIGDFAAATRHLSWDERAAYREMLDVYYSREEPLPLDMKMVYRLTGASTPTQRKAIDAVLSEFFDKTPRGYCNARCEEEIIRANEKKEKAKASAAKRWTSPQQSVGNANAYANAPSVAMPTQSEGNAPNPNPNPNPKLDGRGLARARDPASDLEAQLRDAAGWQNEPAPMLAVTGPIEALIDAGASLETDVLPTIRALAPQARSRANWKYFVSAIAQSRDDRIAAAKTISPQSARNRSHDRNRRDIPQRSNAETILAGLNGGYGQGDPDVCDSAAGDVQHAPHGSD